MNRFSLIFIALFASACASDADVSLDTDEENFRAALEDGDMSEARGSSRAARIANAIINEYGQTAARYGCEIESVVYGFMSSRTPTVKGYVLSSDGMIESTFRSALRLEQSGSGYIYGATKSHEGESGDYFIEGLVDGNVIEASLISSGANDDLALFAELSTRGSRTIVKGIVVDCE